MLAVAGVCVVVTAGYFLTDLLLNISELPKETVTQAVTDAEKSTKAQTTAQAPQPAVISSNMKAVWINADSLSSTDSMKSEIENVKAQGGNAVIVDFKDSSGYLCYDSSLEEMATTEADANAYDAVSDCIALCRVNDIDVIARIFCFKDPLAAGAFKGAMAINYMGNIGMLWLDRSYANGGKPWLNPYSDAAQQYLFDIIKEVCALGVDGVLIDGVQYPSAGLTKATFEGEDEEGALTRNAALVDFIERAIVAAEDTALICMVDGEAAISGTSQIYDGTILNSTAKVFAVDLRGVTVETPVTVAGKTVVSVNNIASGETPYFIIQDS